MDLLHPLHLHLKAHVDLSEGREAELRTTAASERASSDRVSERVFCEHLLLLLYFAGERGDFLGPLAGLTLQQAKLLLEVRQRLGGEVDRQAEVTDLSAQLLLLLLQTGHL